MKPAISERIDDLINIARRLQEIIDQEKPNAPLPTVARCRLAIKVDEAVNGLKAHAEQLAGR